MKLSKNHRLWMYVALALLGTVMAVGLHVSKLQFAAAASGASLPNPIVVESQGLANAGRSGLSQTVNQVAVEVVAVKTIETGLRVSVCYTTLDAGDWYPVPGHLFYGQHDIFPDEFEFTSEHRADGQQAGRRCADVRYQIDTSQAITLPLHVSILAFVAHPREMPACQNFYERVQTNLEAQRYELRVECTETQSGIPEVAVVGFASSFSSEQAKTLVQEILLGEIYGQWSFVLDAID